MEMIINVEKILLYVLMIFLFEPTIFVKYSVLNNIFILGGILSFVVSFILFLKKEDVTISKVLLSVIIYRLITLIVTIFNNGDIMKFGYQTMVIIALYFYAEYFYRNKKLIEFIDVIYHIFFGYLLINIVLYVLFPNGLYALREGIHFLGIRTRFTEYVFTFIPLTYIYYYKKSRNKIKFLISIILAISNIIIPKIATAIIGLIILFLFCLIFNKNRINLVNQKLFLILGLIFTVLIVFFRFQNLFSFLIEDILGKSLTLTGRTYIWDNSYKYIFDKLLLLGHGYPMDGNFIFWRVQLWQAHNQLLQILYESGLIGTVLFYFNIDISLSKLNMCKIRKIKRIITGSIFAYLIMMITEIYGYYIPFYVILILAYYSPYLQNNKEDVL